VICELNTAYYRGAHAVIILYDIANVESFECIPGWMKDVKLHGQEGVDVMIFGCKSDGERVC
jgi:GTPase SAR1 family protein